MPVPPNVLLGSLLKIQRANRHIDELRHVTDPLDRRLYDIVSTYTDTGGPEDQPMAQLVYGPKHPIPELLAIIIGDVIHNLRSALDHLAGGIIRTLPENPLGDKPYFPMASERKNLVSAPSLAAIEQALPGAKKLLLEKIRPADGPNERTWRFNTLNNLDKHNLVIPSVTIVDIQNINATWGGYGTMERTRVRGNAARPMVLMETGEPITVGDNFHTAVDIRFGKGTAPFEDDPVIPTLFQIRDLVGETLDGFGELIRFRLQNPAG